MNNIADQDFVVVYSLLSVVPVVCGDFGLVLVFPCGSNLAILFLRKCELVRAGYFNCVVAVCVLCLFFMVPNVGLQSVIVAFTFQYKNPRHNTTHASP